MNDLQLTSGEELARLDALPDPGAVLVRFERGETWGGVIVTRVGAHVAAFLNRCPHAGYPMERPDGRMVVQQGRFLVCTAHGASFTLTDGACAGGPCNGEALARIAVTVADGVVRVA